MTDKREIHRRGFAVGYEGRMPLELKPDELSRECPPEHAACFFDGLLRGHLERERERTLCLLAETSVIPLGSRAMVSVPTLTRMDETERWSELVVERLQKKRIEEVELSHEPPPPLRAALAAEGIRVLRVLVPTPTKR